MITRALFYFLVVMLSACGYKPTSVYTKNILGSYIYVKVETSLEDPENSVLIRDAVNEAVIYKFHAKVTDIAHADSKVFLRLETVNFQPIEYDKNGYVIAYKTNVTLVTSYHDRAKHIKELKTYGDYDFNIESNSVISDTKRFNAIKEASQKAIDAFISRIAVEGVAYDNK